MKWNSNSHKGLTRRQLLKYGLYGTTAVGMSPSLWLTGCSKASPQKKTNVIFISIDTLRADHLSCYGYKKQTSPSIDKFAAQANLFKNAYTTMPTTLPAHLSLLTSLYPTQLSVRRNGEKVSAEVTTLAEILRSEGYDTAAFVSSYALNSRYGLNQGFQRYDDSLDTSNQRLASNTLSKAAAWLQKHKKKPFFMFVHLFDPHTPYYAPESFRKKFNAPDTKVPPVFGFVPDPQLFSKSVVHNIIDAYDAEIAYSDWAVGQIMLKLDRLGLYESSIIVLLSDHGESLEELITQYGYVFDHGEFLYKHQLHIPMLIRIPCLAPNSLPVYTDPVSIIDVMPTILDALAIEHPSFMAGQSLMPVLRGEQLPNRFVFSERRIFQKIPKPFLAGDGYSIIDNNWHLIFSTHGGSELYDMQDDPHEFSNLQSNEEKIKFLKNNLLKWTKINRSLFGPSVLETNKEALERLRSLGYTY